MTDVLISEFEEIDPEELHLVGKGANGFKALLAKSASEEVRAVLEQVAENLDLEIVKADDGDDAKDCSTCKGSGKIMEGHRKCPKCLGTGIAPKVGQTEKELADIAAKVTAPSGAPVPVTADCPTCNGGGTIADGTADGKTCPDCAGSGKDSAIPLVDKLNAQPGFAGGSDDGGDRLTDDGSAKSALEKKNVDPNVGGGVDRDKIDASDFAGKNRSYPIVKPGDVEDAASSIGRAGDDNYSSDKLKANIISIAKRKGASFVAKLPQSWKDEMGKSGEPVTKDGVTTGANPFLGGAVSTSTTDASDFSDGMDDDDDAGAPGSPEWEAADAALATGAANAILQAYELTRQFRDREAVEMAAGEGNDVFDTFEASCVLDLLSAAIGQMATLAFHEGIAAQKSTEDVAEKAGKRLSTKSVTALAAARDHLTKLLGDDDPAKASDDSDDDDASKSERDILNMTPDELTELVAATVAKAVVEVEKGKSAMDEADAISNAKNANAKGKSNKKKAATTDDTLEDEADQGDADSANTSPAGVGAAKAELTPEEIEANDAAKAAKKEAKRLKKAAKQAAENAAVANAIKEAVTEATEAVNSLQERIASAEKTTEERLATVEKMAAPGGPARTRTPDVTQKAEQHDMLEAQIMTLERVARETTDPDVRKGNLDKIKELRAQKV